jgi:TolA-binding protein
MKLTNENINSFLETENSDFRKKMLDESTNDAFDQDILEGLCFSEIVESDFKKLDKRYYRSRVSLKKWIIEIGVILAIVASLFISRTSSENEEKNTRNISNSKNHTNKTVSDAIAPIIQKINENTYPKQSLKKHLINKSNKEILNQNTQENPANGEYLQTTEQDKMTFLQPKVLSNLRSREEVGIQAIEVFVMDYKTVDYRYYRKTRPKKSDPLSLTNGTPASISEKNDLILEEDEIEYYYFNYLKETMKLFDAKMYDLALENFNSILKTFPDDVNALFYSGLCYFNQQQFNKSILVFESLIKSTFINFKQEAEWQLLLNYIETKQNEKAKKLKNEIIQSEGFYANKALKLKIE